MGKRVAGRLTDRELATVLVALRFWQEEVLEEGTGEIPERFLGHFEDDAPLDFGEVDELCERLNTAS
jgi:hypothetical protein